MKFHHIFKDMVKHTKKRQVQKGKNPSLNWWQLSFIGIGSIIGAGFFLGTGVSIKAAGPSVIIGYLIASLAAFFTFTALAEMTANDPQKGSFRTYARQTYGRGAGFLSGWMYWFAGILIMSSEVTALSTFTQYWFPHIPLWGFSIFYSLIGLGIILMGVENFGRIESLFAVIKLSTLVLFICFGIFLILGINKGRPFTTITPHSPFDVGLFPNGFGGLWTAMIFILFSYGGIAVVGIAANELKSKEDIPKTGYSLMFTLTLVYMASLTFVLSLSHWSAIGPNESPFVTALDVLKIPYLGAVFNIILISAAFSTMVGALYSITNVLVSLAEDGDAPSRFASKNKRGIPMNALFLTSCGIALVLILAFVLPKAVYEYLSTAAGVMLILNWSIILLSELKNRKNYTKGLHFKMPLHPIGNYIGLIVITFAISGAFLRVTERIGVIIAFVIVLGIIGVYRGYNHFSRSRKQHEPPPHH